MNLIKICEQTHIFSTVLKVKICSLKIIRFRANNGFNINKLIHIRLCPKKSSKISFPMDFIFILTKAI